MLLEQTPHRLGIVSPERVVHSFFRRTRILHARLDVLLERRPAAESPFAREDELRAGEDNLLLLRQYGADACSCLGIARSEQVKQLLRELFLLVEIRAGW